jgi:hypothetical protein
MPTPGSSRFGARIHRRRFGGGTIGTVLAVTVYPIQRNRARSANPAQLVG